MHLSIALACMKAKQPISPGIGYHEYRYLVWNTQEKPPFFVHKTKKKAKKEAERLKKLSPLAEFIVLKIEYIV